MRVEKRDNLVAGVVGKDGRTTAVSRCLTASPKIRRVENLSTSKGLTPQQLIDEVLHQANRVRPDFVVVGPEEPLARGLVDRLAERGVPCVGPLQALAELEASKAFTRELLARHGIPGNPAHRIFTSVDGVGEYLRSLGQFVIKPDGLTGGKGVKVSGDHLRSVEEGVAYCEELLRHGQPRIVVEEKLEGEEFSLQSFCDGSHVVDTVVVQDHKRAHEGDVGPNTGGMGTYTDANHLLPFLDRSALAEASAINAQIPSALQAATGRKYKGILFGGFMLTKRGVRLLEYNARFGDPEALNILSILETDFVDVCLGIINETLHEVPITFRRLATVCKYVVPTGYPDQPVKGEVIDLADVPTESEHLKIFPAAVEATTEPNRLRLSGSRAIAFVGIGNTLNEAYRHAEGAAAAVKGPVYHRKDIGSDELVRRREHHMAEVRHQLAV